MHFFGSSQTNHLPSSLPQIVIQHFSLGSKPRYHEIALALTCRGLIVVRGSHIFYVVRPIRFGISGILILQECVVEESNIKPHISATVLQEINDQASHSSHASHATHHGRCHVGHISGRNLFGFAISCPGALKEMCPNNRYILVVAGNHSKKEVLCFWSLSLKLKLFQVPDTDRNCSFTDTSF